MIVFPHCLNFCLDFFVPLRTIAGVSHLICPISPSSLFLSCSVFIKGESYYALRVSQSTADWGSEREGDNVLCGIFFLCMLREFMCGGGGVILEESVSCPRMHVGLPWVNPPCMHVCVCVCLQMVSKSLVAESCLNKRSFWAGFQGDQHSCFGWEVLADRRELKVCSSLVCWLKNASERGADVRKQHLLVRLLCGSNQCTCLIPLKLSTLGIDDTRTKGQANIDTAELACLRHARLHQVWPSDWLWLLTLQLSLTWDIYLYIKNIPKTDRLFVFFFSALAWNLHSNYKMYRNFKLFMHPSNPHCFGVSSRFFILR